MPEEEGDEQYQGCQDEERKTGDKGCLFQMRNKNVSHRKGLNNIGLEHSCFKQSTTE